MARRGRGRRTPRVTHTNCFSSDATEYIVDQIGERCRLHNTLIVSDPPYFEDLLKEDLNTTAEKHAAYFLKVRQHYYNALEWGLALSVFHWLNDYVPARKYREASFMLPALSPLLRNFKEGMLSNAMAQQKIWPIPAERVEGLQRANKLINGSMLLPPRSEHTIPAQSAELVLCDRHEVTIEGWPQAFRVLAGANL